MELIAVRRVAILSAVITAVFGVLAVPADARDVRSLPVQCSGAAPLVCHVDVPPGTYDVAVSLGGNTAGSTGVTAETRRTMLSETATEAGEVVQHGFTLNVREPEGQPTGPSGSPGLDLRFGGRAPRLSAIRVTPAPKTPDIFLAGDSTVCDQATEPYTGWGQQLPQFLRSGVSVANYADSGESSRSFLDKDELFPALETQLRRGDLVLIQLAHNDKETPADVYRANLTAMAERAVAAGGRPVFVTPIVRRDFVDDGSLTQTALHVTSEADLPAEMRSLAEELDVALIDLTGMTERIVEGLGPEASKNLYLTEEKNDDTHTSAYGATVFASLVRDELREQRLVAPRLFR